MDQLTTSTTIQLIRGKKEAPVRMSELLTGTVCENGCTKELVPPKDENVPEDFSNSSTQPNECCKSEVEVV